MERPRPGLAPRLTQPEGVARRSPRGSGAGLSPARAGRVHIWKRPSLIPGLGEIFGDPTQLNLVRHLDAECAQTCGSSCNPSLA